MSNKFDKIMKTLKFNKEITMSGNGAQNSQELTSGPFYSVEYLFISEFHVKLYAMSSTNLNVVNFVPNMELKTKVNFISKITTSNPFFRRNI